MSWADLIAAADRVRATAVGADPGLAQRPLAGVGWATVEAERAMRELDAALAGEDAPGTPTGAAAAWTELERDSALGARIWQRKAAGVPSRPVVLVLEPDTEGRLAASLVRFGEGVAVVYLGEGAIAAGHLLPSGKPWGPHVVLV